MTDAERRDEQLGVEPRDGSQAAEPFRSDAAAEASPTTGSSDADEQTPAGGTETEAPVGDAETSTTGLAERAAADPRDRVELLAELLEAAARRDEYLEDVRRARAEFENYRKRVMREGAAQREAGKAETVSVLLEVLDDLDRTLEAADRSEDERLAKGVELVADKLVGALRTLGLERIDDAGAGFDPTRHEAVQHREAAEPSGEPVVAEVLRPGYVLGERVLRAAMVVVEE